MDKIDETDTAEKMTTNQICIENMLRNTNKHLRTVIIKCQNKRPMHNFTDNQWKSHMPWQRHMKLS